MAPPNPTVDMESVNRLKGPRGHRWCSVNAPMHLGQVAMDHHILTQPNSQERGNC